MPRPAAAVAVAMLIAFATCASAGAAPAGRSARVASKRCPRAQLPPGTALGSVRLRRTRRCLPFVRTPDERFAHLPGFAYPAHYAAVDGLRMAYVDQGPRDGQVILLLHGEPTWGYLYRKMIPRLAAAGYRVIAPDLIGMGRSDKPVQLADYSYLRHVRWVEAFIARLGLRDITAFVQDWGSLIGLRVVGDHPDLFARVVVANGTLPLLPEGARLFSVPRRPAPDPAVTLASVACHGVGSFCFADWARFTLTGTRFRASDVVDASVTRPLSRAERTAYDAPFPRRVFMAGARIFPSLINTVGEAPTNDAAGRVLDTWTKPFLTLWGDRDPIFGADTGYQAQLRDRVPGARGQPNHTYPDAGHFVQEDEGPDLARRIGDFVAANPATSPK